MVIIAIIGGIKLYNNHKDTLEGDWVVVSIDGDSSVNQYLATFTIGSDTFKSNVSDSGSAPQPSGTKQTLDGKFTFDKKARTFTLNSTTGTYILSDDKKRQH